MSFAIERLKKRGTIKDYSKGKSGLAATNRYHINLVLETHKEYYTKIDVDFVKPVKALKQKGELFYYPLERLFIGKSVTFVDRKEFKDIYDIAYILPKLDLKNFRNNPNVITLIDDLINAIQNEDTIFLYKRAFRNVDLRFKYLRESYIDRFITKLIRELRILKNKISR